MLRFGEVIAEYLVSGAPPALVTLRDRGVTVIPHGVTLSLAARTARYEPNRASHGVHPAAGCARNKQGARTRK